MRQKTLKYILGLLPLIAGSNSVLAQTTTAKSTTSPMLTWIFNNVFLLGSGIVIAAGIFAIYRFAIIMLEIERLATMRKLGIEAPQQVTKVAKESLWKRLNKKAWNLTPIAKEKDILLDHNYDGIKELDNHLPPWWVATFYGCILIGVAYFSYYHVFDYGLSSSEQYEQEIIEGEEAVKRFLATQTKQINESTVTMVTDASELERGQSMYEQRCSPCHGVLAEGITGPNLTDKYWLHGGDLGSVFRTITYGVSGKGMQAWKDFLRPEDIQTISSYILTLQDSNPPNAKAPEGDLFEPEEIVEEIEDEGEIGMK